MGEKKWLAADGCLFQLNKRGASGVNKGNSANQTVLSKIQHAASLKCALHRNAESQHSSQLLCNYTLKNV